MLVKGCELFWSPTCFPARSPCSSVTQCLPWDPALFWSHFDLGFSAGEMSSACKRGQSQWKQIPVSFFVLVFISKQKHSFMCRTAPREGLRSSGSAWQGSPEANASQKKKLIKCLVTRSAAPGSLPVPGPSKLSPGIQGVQGPAQISASFSSCSYLALC